MGNFFEMFFEFIFYDSSIPCKKQPKELLFTNRNCPFGDFLFRSKKTDMLSL
jgi:hypothetical protein